MGFSASKTDDPFERNTKRWYLPLDYVISDNASLVFDGENGDRFGLKEDIVQAFRYVMLTTWHEVALALSTCDSFERLTKHHVVVDRSAMGSRW